MGRSYSSGGSPVPFDFELDGVEFIAAGGVPVLEMSEVAAREDEDIDSAAGFAAMALVFRHALGPDYERFREHVRRHNTGRDVLLQIIRDMAVHLAESPTQPSGRSSSGRPDTAGTSRDDSRETVPLSDEEIRAWRAAHTDTRSPE